MRFSLMVLVFLVSYNVGAFDLPWKSEQSVIVINNHVPEDDEAFNRKDIDLGFSVFGIRLVPIKFMDNPAELSVSEAAQYVRSYPCTILARESGAVTVTVPKEGLYWVVAYIHGLQYNEKIMVNIGGVVCMPNYHWKNFPLKNGSTYTMDLWWDKASTLNGIKGGNVTKESAEKGMADQQ